MWLATSEDEMCQSIMKNLENFISVDEKVAIEKYYFQADRKRSLLSLLLQKAIIRQQFQLSNDDITIRRTKEVVTSFKSI